MSTLAVGYDTKSNVSLVCFRSQLEAFYVSIQHGELWFKSCDSRVVIQRNSLFFDDYIFIVGLSSLSKK